MEHTWVVVIGWHEGGRPGVISAAREPRPGMSNKRRCGEHEWTLSGHVNRVKATYGTLNQFVILSVGNERADPPTESSRENLTIQAYSELTLLSNLLLTLQLCSV